MKLVFIGADHEVTGSCHYMEVGSKKFCVDIGMEQVYATKATVELSQIMLRDSAHIQQFEAEWRNRKAQRSGGEVYEPLYTMEDALGAIRLMTSCDYGSMVHICDEVVVRFTDIGHLLGSSSIEVFAKENGKERTVVFSGDIGNDNKPILKNPTYTKAADYVVMESTYGDRLHGEAPDYVGDLAKIIQEGGTSRHSKFRF